MLVLIINALVCSAVSAAPPQAPASSTGPNDFTFHLDEKIALGGKVTKEDLAKLNSELESNKNNQYTRMVIGEALSSMGLFQSAHLQFAEAEKLEKDYVLRRFRAFINHNPHMAALLFPYIQDVYPRDSGLLYFLANKNMREKSISAEQRKWHMDTARKELTWATQLADPWPGTFSTLAVLDYNDALLNAKGEEQQRLFRDAVNAANRQLRSDPSDTVARKTKMMSLLRLDEPIHNLLPELKSAVEFSPADATLNVLLAKALISQNHYEEAVPYVLLALYLTDGSALTAEAKGLLFTLLNNVKLDEILTAVDQIAKTNTPRAAYRAQLMRLNLAMLLLHRGNRLDAIAQLTRAARLHSNNAAYIEFELAKQYADMQDYRRAFTLAELAAKDAGHSGFAAQYQEFAKRIAERELNRPRDLALMLKYHFHKGKYIPKLSG